MQLTDQRIGNARVLKVSGRIDHAGAEDFKVALQSYLEQGKAGGEVVVLDFSAVDYISSVGFRVLLLADRQAREQQGAIAVAALQPVVKEIFEISKFTKVVACFEDVRSALAALSPSPLTSHGPV